MPAKLSKLNQSVEKALQIIEIMMKEPEAMRLQDIALKAEMPPSTAPVSYTHLTLPTRTVV